MNANDLTFLAAVKAWAGVTSSTDDTKLAALVTAVSRAMLTQSNRPSFGLRTIATRLDGLGRSRILLPEWPVISIASLSIGGTAVPAAVTPSQSNPFPTGYLLSVWDGIPPGGMQFIDLFGYCAPIGPQSLLVSLVLGYIVQNEASTIAATTIPALAQPYGPWSGDAGVTLANGMALTKVTVAPAASQYQVTQDPSTGAAVYAFNAADNGKAILVSYSYIPADVYQAATEWAAERYKYADRIGMRSKSLGGQESVSFDISAVPKFVSAVLDQYKSVVAF